MKSEKRKEAQMFICKCGTKREIVFFPEVTQCHLCKRVGCWEYDRPVVFENEIILRMERVPYEVKDEKPKERDYEITA